MKTVIVLNRDQLGEGDAELGRKALTTCLRKLITFENSLEAILFYNSGVKLTAKDSYVAVELTQLHDNGVEILPCTTCVEHYGLQGKLIVEKSCTMDDILTAMRMAEKVITL